MMKIITAPTGRCSKALLLVGLTFVVTMTVYASKNMVQDRRVTLDEAQGLAAKASENTEFQLSLMMKFWRTESFSRNSGGQRLHEVFALTEKRIR